MKSRCEIPRAAQGLARSPGGALTVRVMTHGRKLGCAVLVSLVALGCGGSTPPPRQEKEPERAFRTGGDESNVDVSAEVGGLPEAAVRSAFKRAEKGFLRCLTEGYGRIEFMGGEVAFYVAVGKGGTIARAYLERSTIGDRDTEQCLVDVLRKQKWPAPVGGEVGEARNSLTFDPPADVRPPLDWSENDLGDGLGRVRKELDDCKQQAGSGTYTVTMYVDPDGTAKSVGVSSPTAGADVAMDCIVGVLRSAKFSSPGSYAAKVTFDL